jgi:hypothetical protein
MKDLVPGSIEGRCIRRGPIVMPRRNLPVPPNPFPEVRFADGPSASDQKSSPSRLRFRPPPPLTFPFRVLPSGATSSYSRSVLGASSTLTPRRNRSRGVKGAKCANCVLFFFQHRDSESSSLPRDQKEDPPAPVRVERVGPKKFAEPISLSSPASADLPLPGTAFGLGFDLLALRARRKQHTNRWSNWVKGSKKDEAAICGNFFFQHFHSHSSNVWTRLWRGS